MKPRSPFSASLKGATLHSSPANAKAHKIRGNVAAGWRATCQGSPRDMVGINTTSQSAIKIPVAVVDQGNDTATATTSQSDRSIHLLRSKLLRLAGLKSIRVDGFRRPWWETLMLIRTK